MPSRFLVSDLVRMYSRICFFSRMLFDNSAGDFIMAHESAFANPMSKYRTGIPFYDT